MTKRRLASPLALLLLLHLSPTATDSSASCPADLSALERRVRAFCASDSPASTAPASASYLDLCGEEHRSEERTGQCTGGHSCRPPAPSFCAALRSRCGKGREGSLCVKSGVEQRLRGRGASQDGLAPSPSPSRVFPAMELYFLCSHVEIKAMQELRGSSTPRSRNLTSLLVRAVDASLPPAAGEHASGHAMGASDESSEHLWRYRRAAQWSNLCGWSTAEKASHFLDALALLPDNLHSIDRLAVTLSTPGAAPPLRRARSLLLHYAVLRGLIRHPLQRPLSAPFQGLAARPWWDVEQLAKFARDNAVGGVGGGDGGGDGGGSGGGGGGDGESDSGSDDVSSAAVVDLTFLAGPATLVVLQEELAAYESAEVRTAARTEARTIEARAGVGESAGKDAQAKETGAKAGEEGGAGERDVIEVAPQTEGIHEGGGWSEIHLIKGGRAVHGAETRFPRTMRLLQASQIEFINARFSALRPQTHITPHCGVSNAKLRAHVAVRVPRSPATNQTNETPLSHSPPSVSEQQPGQQPGQQPRQQPRQLPTQGRVPLRSGIRVGDQQVRQWKEGEILLFDDSFEHEVWWQWAPGSDPCGADAGVGTDMGAGVNVGAGAGADTGAGVGAGVGIDDIEGHDRETEGTASARVVLIVDVFHPQLSSGQRDVLRRSL